MSSCSAVRTARSRRSCLPVSAPTLSRRSNRTMRAQRRRLGSPPRLISSWPAVSGSLLTGTRRSWALRPLNRTRGSEAFLRHRKARTSPAELRNRDVGIPPPASVGLRNRRRRLSTRTDEKSACGRYNEPRSRYLLTFAKLGCSRRSRNSERCQTSGVSRARSGRIRDSSLGPESRRSNFDAFGFPKLISAEIACSRVSSAWEDEDPPDRGLLSLQLEMGPHERMARPLPPLWGRALENQVGVSPAALGGSLCLRRAL